MRHETTGTIANLTRLGLLVAALVAGAAGPAVAQAPGGSDFLMTIAPLFIILAIMYVLVLRPQQRRMKDMQQMISGIQRGDRVVMTGGLMGRVTKVIDDRELELEIADGVRVRVSRPSVAEVRTKAEANAPREKSEAAKS